MNRTTESAVQQRPFSITWVVQNAVHSVTALCVVIDSFSRSSEEMGKWPYHSKDEMKHLGGTLYLMNQKFREFVILGISKIVEDAFNDLKQVSPAKFSIWSSEIGGLRHAREARWIRHVGNVIKHNNSFISSAEDSDSSRRLVTEFGVRDETSVACLDEFAGYDMRAPLLRYTYYAYVFVFDLMGHLGVKWRDISEKSFHEIPDYMLNHFVRDLPGHPERSVDG